MICALGKACIVSGVFLVFRKLLFAIPLRCGVGLFSDFSDFVFSVIGDRTIQKTTEETTVFS